MQSRPTDSPEPAGTPPPGPAAAHFLSTGALQDPTLRTPGSEIPEAVYAASDSEPFSPAARLTATRLTAPARADDPRLALLIALLLLGIIAATATYLYIDTHRQPPGPSPASGSPAHVSLEYLAPFRSARRPHPHPMA